jgi:hypothetical protein
MRKYRKRVYIFLIGLWASSQAKMKYGYFNFFTVLPGRNWYSEYRKNTALSLKIMLKGKISTDFKKR